MSKHIDLTGKRFGSLVVISRNTGYGNGSYWVCICDCGVNIMGRSDRIRNGMTRNCGRHGFSSMMDKFNKNYMPEPVSGCWLWTASLSNNGYGSFTHLNKTYSAHTISFELFKGDRKGLFVCHTCDVRSCVNPDHLILGTHLDNMQDMVRRGRSKKTKKNKIYGVHG